MESVAILTAKGGSTQDQIQPSTRGWVRSQAGEEDVSAYEPMKNIRRPDKYNVADLVKLDGLKAKP